MYPTQYRHNKFITLDLNASSWLSTRSIRIQLLNLHQIWGISWFLKISRQICTQTWRPSNLKHTTATAKLFVSLLRWLRMHHVWLRSHSALLALATKVHRGTVEHISLSMHSCSMWLAYYHSNCIQSEIVDKQMILICLNIYWARLPGVSISTDVAFAPSRELTLLLIVP